MISIIFENFNVFETNSFYPCSVYLGRVQGVQTPALFGTVQIVPLSSQTHLEETLWKISLKYERIYQNDALREFFEVFQRYFRKGNNKCGIRECGTKECRINFWQTVFKSQTWIPRFILLFSFHMLCYFRVIHILYFHISRQFKNDFVAISFNTKYTLDWKIIF